MNTSQNLPVPANLPAVIPPTAIAPQSTFKMRIDSTTGVHIDEHDYIKHKKLPGGYLLARLDHPDIIQEFSFEELEELRQADRLSVTHQYHSSRSASGRLNSDNTYLSDLPEPRQTAWADRLEIVEDFIVAERGGQYSRSDKSLKRFIEAWFIGRVKTSTGRFGKSFDIDSPPSPTSLRRWLRSFEACDHDPAALIDGYGRSGNRDARLDAKVAGIMASFAAKYMSNLKPSMASVYRDMRSEFRQKHPDLTVPSRNTFERAIRKLDPFEVMAAREGEAVARRKLYAVRDRVDVTRPLQRVELDEQLIPLQAMLIERGKWDTLPAKLKAGITHDRLWCSKIIDTWSRVVLGFVITRAPSAASALATLRMALEDKTAFAAAMGCQSPWDMYGLPELIVTDSGSNFRSKAFRAAVLDLGSSIMIAPAGLPQMRGPVERSFRTDSQFLYSQVPGYSFSNVVEKGEYESEENIAVTIMELAKMMVRYWVDIYHNSPHAGLGGDTPANRYRTGVDRFGVLPPPPRDVVRHIFCTVIECRVGNKGVRVAGLYYQSKALQQARRTIRDKYALVRVDTEDLSCISVKTDDGWITVPCSTEGFEGVSLDHWKMGQAALRWKYASVAALSEEVVAKALLDIRAEVEQLRLASNVPSPIMSSESLITFNRDLERGFDMVRPEDGEVGTMPEALDHYGSKAVKEEDIVPDTPMIAPTARFFKE
jgi:putative transposase